MAYTVFRCDNMPGTDQRAYIASVLVQDSSGNPIEVENGTIVEIGDLIDGKHDLYAATLATKTSTVANCAVIGTPEVIHDDHLKKNLDDFINEAGKPATAYLLGHGGVFSVTKEGFVNGTVPTKAGKTVAVGIGTNGKIDSAGTGLGTILAIDQTNRYTYYAVRL